MSCKSWFGLIRSQNTKTDRILWSNGQFTGNTLRARGWNWELNISYLSINGSIYSHTVRLTWIASVGWVFDRYFGFKDNTSRRHRIEYSLPCLSEACPYAHHRISKSSISFWRSKVDNIQCVFSLGSFITIII